MYQQQICRAIRAKKNVLIKYDDDVLDRTFSPHILFYFGNDKRSVAGIQVGNPAEPSERTVWRSFTLERITSLGTADSTFSVDTKFDHSDKRYRSRVVCHVSRYRSYPRVADRQPAVIG